MIELSKYITGQGISRRTNISWGTGAKEYPSPFKEIDVFNDETRLLATERNHTQCY